MYEIKAEDIYEEFSKNKEMLEFSKYPAESKCYDNLKKLVVGKMKGKTGGVPFSSSEQ